MGMGGAYITPQHLVDFGLHHDRMIIDGSEWNGIWMLPVLFLGVENKTDFSKTIPDCQNQLYIWMA